MTIPQFAPGCFGSAVAYSNADNICGACPFSAQCSVAHEINKNELRRLYGIKIPDQRKTKTVTDESGNTSLALPVKTQALLAQIDKSKIDICGSLKKGINPFATKGPKYLNLLCHLLLRTKRPIPNDFLAVAFSKKFDWRDNTSKIHARIAVQALEHVGAIIRIDGAVCLKDNSPANTY